MKRGEIYIVDLGPPFGNERGGTRPVVVVTDDMSNLHPYMIAVVAGEDAATMSAKSGTLVSSSESGAPVDVVFLTHQLRTLDPSRFPDQPWGVVPPHLMEMLTLALKVYLDIP